MTQNCILQAALSCALVFAAGFPFGGSRALAATPPGDAKAEADQEVLKIRSIGLFSG